MRSPSSAQPHHDDAVLTPAVIVTSAATLVLFISLFFDWFSIDGVSYGNAFSWDGYLIVVAIVSVVLLADLARRVVRGRSFLPLAQEQLMIGGTAVNLVLVLIAFLDRPSAASYQVGWSAGAIIALVFAVIALAPSLLPGFLARASEAIAHRSEDSVSSNVPVETLDEQDARPRRRDLSRRRPARGGRGG
jgi:hypothetical protein